MTEWLDIETAPKDGTHIIIGGANVHPTEGKWRGRGQRLSRYEEQLEEGWTRVAFPDYGLFPTHWMPLPEPPK